MIFDSSKVAMKKVKHFFLAWWSYFNIGSLATGSKVYEIQTSHGDLLIPDSYPAG
jgi:hypothetical protein